jgi:hypothetical protein
VQSNPSLKHPVSDAVFLIPMHHIVLESNRLHIPRVLVSRPHIRLDGVLVVPHAKVFSLPHTFPVTHGLDALPLVLLSMLSGARAGSNGSAAGGPFAHISAPQVATFLAASASGDKTSALSALSRTVSTI